MRGVVVAGLVGPVSRAEPGLAHKAGEVEDEEGEEVEEEEVKEEKVEEEEVEEEEKEEVVVKGKEEEEEVV